MPDRFIIYGIVITFSVVISLFVMVDLLSLWKAVESNHARRQILRSAVILASTIIFGIVLYRMINDTAIDLYARKIAITGTLAAFVAVMLGAIAYIKTTKKDKSKLQENPPQAP